MTERARNPALLRAVPKLILVAVVAAGGGLGLGVGYSALSGGGAAKTGGSVASTAQGSPAAGGTSTEASSQPSQASQQPSQVQVTPLSAVLRRAGTAYGRQRRRARLVIEVRARNAGNQPVTPPRPALLTAGATLHADAHGGAPGTTLGSLSAGETKVVQLRFEVVGAVTTRLAAQRSAHVIVAGQSLTLKVTIGPPV